LLGKGDHQVTSSWTDHYGSEFATTLYITRSNITFLGTGKDTTTILGGLYIENHENITFKEMTMTNTDYGGCGIRMSNANVELIDVALKGNGHAGLFIPVPSSETTVVATRCEFANGNYGAAVHGSLASATFKNCVFNDNSGSGILGSDNAIIHLHGEGTAIHSNRRFGIYAYDSAKVIIHRPSHHNTSYNNGEDRKTIAGGIITNVED